jgi:aminopeptidase YwaD
MYKLYSIIIILFISNVFGQNQNNPDITSFEIQDHINFLASDELKGRFTGTPEADKAAQYIADEFKQYGIQPLVNSSYFQDFPFISGIERTKNNSLNFINTANISPTNAEFTPLPFSGTGEVKGDLVFAGYGISAPDLNYDDYADVDVNGKIVLVMRYNPEGTSPMSKFEKYSAMRLKASTAKDKGAAGIIFVNGHAPKNDADILTTLTYDGAPGIENFPAVQIKRNIADKLFSSSGKDFKKVQEGIDSAIVPASFKFSDIKAALETEVKQIESNGRNVAGILKASSDKYPGEYIIIGAHYDHLGMGVTGSLHKSSEPAIHNGADDNASGTTGVLELAEKFASEKNNLDRSMIFLAFAGEELGLLGSSYFVKNPPVPIDSSALMINLDMIGRLNEDADLTVYGTGTSTKWKDLLTKTNEGYNFNISMVDDGFGPSDHSSFYGANIPVLFFFTGIHSDYHRPSDDPENINAEGQEKILNMVYDIASEVNMLNSKPEYVSVPRKDMGRSTSFRVYVGTVPDFGSNEEGYKVSSVTDGSPAQKGGIKGGDIMINFGGKKISNIYDYTYALGEYSPGDSVDVVVLRDGKEVKLKVELGAR